MLGDSHVLRTSTADVAAAREVARKARWARAGVLLGVIALFLWTRVMAGRPPVPSVPEGFANFVPVLFLVGILTAVLVLPLLAAGRSPHVLYRPSEIDVALADVKGMAVVMDEVVKSLNLFLAFKTFRERMGGTPRRALLFEGPPGTGKTYMAKALAREASVPFLFVSSSAFQSMYYGATNRKIRSYFRELRKAARRHGGAIGFIEEIDAIGAARSGMGGGGGREGISGVVNELLIQMQSFDTPPPGDRMKGFLLDFINLWRPHSRQFSKPKSQAANILVIGATNRAADLDPALLRPGRFDRSIHFDLPGRSGRREIIDYYLSRKSHVPDLDLPERRNTLAAMTAGYSPVMIEHLIDEALVWALRRGSGALDWEDLQQAKYTEEIGLKQPVEYTDVERHTIATHEAGHATVAHLVGKDRKLEVLSIVKRKQALGLLAHSELEERFTKTRSEINALIQIAFGGMVAEEMYYGESGTGPASDLQAATTLAAQMVGAYGMSGSLISYNAVESQMTGIVGKVLSADSGKEAVEDILAAAKGAVREMLEANRKTIEALRDALLERQELIGDEITEVIKRAEGKVPVTDSSLGSRPHLRLIPIGHKKGE